MRVMFILLATALLNATPALAVPVPTESELRAECSGDPGGEAGMRDCLAAKALASAAELRRAEAAMRAALPRVDIWPRFVASAKRSFVRANRAFIRYLAAQCAFNESLAGGAAGNSHAFMQMACVAELNFRRAAQLRLQTTDILKRGL
jgi:Lysozyme inhibitor LprI